MDQAAEPRIVPGEKLIGGKWTPTNKQEKDKVRWPLVLPAILLVVLAGFAGYWWAQQQASDLASAMKNAGFTNVTLVKGGDGPNAIDSATSCGQTIIFVQREIAGGMSIMTLASVREDGSLNFQVTPCNEQG